MANNVNWGWIGSRSVDLMLPGTTAGDGRCEGGQFGLAVEDVVVYSDLETLRDWLRSALDELPPGRALVTVDTGRQWRWLGGLKRFDRPDWQPNVDTVLNLFKKLLTNPAAAGWTPGLGVKKLWAGRDEDTDGLMAGVKLRRGPRVAFGEPLTDDDLTVRLKCSRQEAAHAALNVIAERINLSI